MSAISDEKMQEIARTIRRRRKDLGMNQTQLSLLAGCGRLFVSQLEGGKSTVQFDKLLDVLSCLGLTLSSGRGPLIIEEKLAQYGN
jgi:HTH-type transcriptional regulator / antitoxin HipB